MDVPRHQYRFLSLVLLFLAVPALANEAQPLIQQAAQLAEQLTATHPEERPALEAERAALLNRARAIYEAEGAHRYGAAAFYDYLDVLHLLACHDQIIDALKDPIQRHGDDGRAQFYLGRAHLLVGPHGYRDAVAPLRGAVALKAGPDPGAAQALLGEAYYRAGLYDLARQQFEAALAEDSANVVAAIELGLLEIRNGDIVAGSGRLDTLGRSIAAYDAHIRVRIREALEHAETYGLQVDDTSDGHAAYGKSLYRAARIGAALPAIKRAIALDPTNTDLMNFLGAMHQQVGDLAGAQKAFAESLRTKPDQAAVQSTLERIEATLQENAARPAP